MADIFISYAKEDRSRVASLAKALAEHGWSIWWDRTIPAGKTWREVIGEALESARSVVVVWSKTSVKSRWVQEEADWGLERKILIPILLDEIRPPLGFGAIQAVDLVHWDPAQSSPDFEKLISDISMILGTSPKQVKEPEKTEEQARKRKEAEEKSSAQKEEAGRKTNEEHKRKQEEEGRQAEERRRLEQEQKGAEAERKAEEERKRKEVDEKRKAEEVGKRKEAEDQEGTTKAEAERQVQEERKHKEAKEEAQRARKDQFEKKAEASKKEPRKPIPAKANIAEAKIEEHEPSETIPDTPSPQKKRLSSKISLLIGLVVMAGVISLFFRQEPTKSKIEISAPQVKSEEHQKPLKVDPITLNYSIPLPASHKVCMIATEWAREIEKRTNGALKITMFPGSSLTPHQETYDGVLKGIADIGMSSIYFPPPAKFPLTEVINLPLGYKNSLAATKLINIYYNKFKPQEFNDVKVMYFHASGPRILHSKQPIKSLNELKGMLIVSRGIGQEIVKALGASPLLMPSSEMYFALLKSVAAGVQIPLCDLKELVSVNK